MPLPSPLPSAGRERATLVGVVVLFSMLSFVEIAALAILPTAAKELGGIGSFGWVYTGFLTAKIVGLILAGAYSDSHGPRLVLTAGLTMFLTAVIICASAPTMSVLVLGRVGQGLASGSLLTAIYVVIGQVFRDEAVPKVQSAIGSAFIVPSLVGPLLAGAVAQHVGWRWVFVGLLPFLLVGIGLMMPVLRTLHRPPVPAVRRGILPSALAVAAAIAALERVGQHPPSWPLLATIGVALGGVLVWRLRDLLPAGTFRLRRGVAAPIGLRAIYAGAFLGLEAVVPLMLTLQHGYGATAAAAPLAVSGVLWAFGAWVQSRAPTGDERQHRLRLVRVGFGLTTAGAIAAATVSYPAVPGWWIFTGWCLAGVGAGLSYTTFNVLVLQQTTDADRGFVSAASQLSGNVGTAITTGLGGVLIAAADRGALGFDTAFLTLNLTMAALLVLGLSFAGRLRRPAAVLA